MNLSRLAVLVPLLFGLATALSSSRALAQSDGDLEKELEADPILSEAPPAETSPRSAPVQQAEEPKIEGTPSAKADEPSVVPSIDEAGKTEPAAKAQTTNKVETKAAAKNSGAKNQVMKDSTAGDQEIAPIFDSPNRALEGRLNRIYRRNSAPIPEDKWDQIIGAQRSEIYRVRKGNTLSGISASLFGDKTYWPKIWSENGGVENPHLIVPGKSVRFMPGTEEDAPAITLADPERLASEVDLLAPTYDVEAPAPVSPEDATAGTVLDEMEIDRPIVPAPERSDKKGVAKIPPSFRSEVSYSNVGYDRSGLSVVRNKAQTVPSQVIPSHYWVDEKPSGVGRVAEIEAAEAVAGPLQSVLVKMSRPVKLGERFSIVSPAGSADESLLRSGVILEVGGVIEITGVADRTDAVYRAIVLAAVGPIRLDAIVMEGKLPRVDFTRNGAVKKVAATVIGGEFESHRKVLGTGSVVYIDAGSASGLAVGDLLAVRGRRATRWENTRFPDVSRPIAIAKVVHVQTNGATAFLIDTEGEVLTGDTTGGPLPVIGRRGLLLQRSQMTDIDAIIQRQRERSDKVSGWQKTSK